MIYFFHTKLKFVVSLLTILIFLINYIFVITFWAGDDDPFRVCWAPIFQMVFSIFMTDLAFNRRWYFPPFLHSFFRFIKLNIVPLFTSTFFFHIFVGFPALWKTNRALKLSNILLLVSLNENYDWTKMQYFLKWSCHQYIQESKMQVSISSLNTPPGCCGLNQQLPALANWIKWKKNIPKSSHQLLWITGGIFWLSLGLLRTAEDPLGHASLHSLKT